MEVSSHSMRAPSHRREAGAPNEMTAVAEELARPRSVTVHVAIGNSDDRLTQATWAAFVDSTDELVRRFGDPIYGFWVAPAASPYQNAAWAFQLDPALRPDMKFELAQLAGRFHQESVAWNESETEFIRPDGSTEPLLPHAVPSSFSGPTSTSTS